MKIGIIQTGRIGDIIIAMPIAQYFIELGHIVIWPIDERWFDFFKEADPRISFVSVQHQFCKPDTFDWLVENPKAILQHYGCDIIHILYSSFLGVSPERDRLCTSLKFDEFKYAICNVPFEKKWHLSINRNKSREMELLGKLNLTGDYVVVHSVGSNESKGVNIILPKDIQESCQVVTISPLSPSLFDWIPILEGAKELFLVDSSPANLVEQLCIKTKKNLYLISEALFTPVYANGWTFK